MVDIYGKVIGTPAKTNIVVKSVCPLPPPVHLLARA
jgi:hypothetical protein